MQPMKVAYSARGVGRQSVHLWNPSGTDIRVIEVVDEDLCRVVCRASMLPGSDVSVETPDGRWHTRTVPPTEGDRLREAIIDASKKTPLWVRAWARLTRS